jgi:hypothetical protein
MTDLFPVSEKFHERRPACFHHNVLVPGYDNSKCFSPAVGGFHQKEGQAEACL